MRAVLDTNVVVSAIRSPTGASSALLRAAAERRITLVCNAPLFLEYEAVLKRPEHLLAAGLTEVDIDTVLAGLASLIDPAGRGPSARPQLSDPNDEFVLDAAIFGRADAIVTFEIPTFSEPAKRFGIETMTPRAVWGKIRP